MTWNTYEELQYIIEEEDNEVLSSDSLYKRIKDNLNYSIEYAEGRVKQLYEHMDGELYANCLSSDKYINEQVKKKSSARADEEGYSHHLDKLADYILYSAHNNEEEKLEYESKKERIKKMSKSKAKNTKQNLFHAKSSLTKPHKADALRPSRTKQVEFRIESLTSIEEGEEDGYSFPEVNRHRVFYTWKDHQVNNKGNFKNIYNYWIHFSQHNNRFKSIFYIPEEEDYFHNVAYDSIRLIEKDIEDLEGALLTPLSEEKRKKIKKGITYSRSNLTKSLEILRDPMVTNSTIYGVIDLFGSHPLEKADYNSYELVKTLLFDYQSLNDKHRNKVGTSLWVMLQDFSSALSNIKFNKTQQELVDYIIKDSEFTYKDLEDHLLNTFSKEYKRTNINYHITNIVRNISLEMVK